MGGSRLAEGGDMQRGRRGSFRAGVGTGKAGPASHGLPSCLCLGQSSPQLGPLLPKEGLLKVLGPQMGPLSQALAPAGPCSCCHPRGRVKELSSQSQPLTDGGFGPQPQLLSSEPHPPPTQPWRVCSPPGGSPSGLTLASPQIS